MPNDRFPGFTGLFQAAGRANRSDCDDKCCTMFIFALLGSMCIICFMLWMIFLFCTMLDKPTKVGIMIIVMIIGMIYEFFYKKI